jgi:hypothetical protein
MSDLKFFIGVNDGIMAVYNVAMPITIGGALSGLQYVIYNDGKGEIEAATGVGIRTTFADPSPYQTYLNSWLTAAAAAAPALTLAQAQQIKTEMVKAIFDAKRQSALAYTVSAGAYSWDCSDQAIIALNTAFAVAMQGGVTTALSDLITAIDAALTLLNSNCLGNDLGLGLAITVLSAAVSAGTVVLDAGSIVLPANVPAANQAAAGLEGNIVRNSAPSLGAADAVPVAMSWTPIGHAIVSLTSIDASGLMSAIATRRAAALLAEQTLIANIAALTTVAQVVAFDVTAGWPF